MLQNELLRSVEISGYRNYVDWDNNHRNLGFRFLADRPNISISCLLERIMMQDMPTKGFDEIILTNVDLSTLNSLVVERLI